MIFCGKDIKIFHGKRRTKPKTKLIYNNLMAKMGRPTKYHEGLIEKVEEYLRKCVDEEYDWTKTEGDKTQTFEHRTKVKIPTIEGFSTYIDCAIHSIYDWAKEHPDFSHALEAISKEQKSRLLEKGLSGDYNPTIAKLMLTVNHGMREGVDITTNGKDLPIPILANLRKEEDK